MTLELASSDIQSPDQMLCSFSSFYCPQGTIWALLIASRRSFTMAVAVPTVIRNKKAAHRRGSFLSVFLIFINRETFPRSWSWLLVFIYIFHFAFLLLQLKLRFSTQMHTWHWPIVSLSDACVQLLFSLYFLHNVDRESLLLLHLCGRSSWKLEII